MAEKIVISQIQFKRGLESELPEFLGIGEFGWATDTGKLFIGGTLSDQIITQRAYTDALEERTLENFEALIENIQTLDTEKLGKNDLLDGGTFIVEGE